jgi:ribonuclease BN (tRNA processing enzyme)
MEITVLGGCGAWPAAGQACSGFLVEHAGFRLLLDPGYATLPRLLERLPAGDLDAVLVSHRHPDHCADLNPLLRARALGGDGLPALPVYSLPGALDAVLALDNPQTLAGAYEMCPLAEGAVVEIGPFRIETRLLPHFVPNLGVRVAAGPAVVAYTGDTGPSGDVVRLAAGADVLLAEATYVEQVPASEAAYLSSARDAAAYAVAADVGLLVLTHLWPGSDPAAALACARRVFHGPTDVARPGLVVEVP